MKARLLSPLLVEILDDERVRLLAPFLAEVDGERLEVPAGFVCDLASVPRVPLLYLIAGGKMKKASVFHDWLYRAAEYPRAWCDEAFAALGRATGVAAWRRGLMWAGVRLGGAGSYGSS